MEAASLALSAAQSLLTALQCPDLREMSSIFNYKSHFDELQNTVSTVKAVLKDAETKQELSNHELNYIRKLKDAVYDADDLFDKFVTIAQQKQLMQDGKVTERVRLFFSRFNPLVVASKMSKRVKKIKRKLEGIANDHNKFGFWVDSRPIRKRREETCSYVYEGRIVGREYDVEKIVSILLDSNVQLEIQQDVFFLSIVGIQGLGKTTLAQLLFNDERVTRAFSKRLWTCVSDHDQQKLDLDLILRKILTSATGVKHEGLPMEEVQKQLRGELASNRYLLVLDDVWTENRRHWLDFVGYLLGGQRGSWIVVTTRSEETARIIGSNSVHKLQGLSEEDSWNLFMKEAFGLEQTNPPDDDLVAIGEKIVKGCAGVPIALRVVGSLLYGQDKSKWVSVQTMRLAEIREYCDVTLLGSGHGSSPGSGHNSGYNSMGDDISGHLFWQQPSRGRSKYSPVASPRTSPGPSSRVQSGSVTPIHPRAAGTGSEAHASWGGDGRKRHHLPLPPLSIPNPSPFSHWNSAATSPSVSRSPTREENLPSPTSRWKKGRLLGRGTFGHVYLGFNSETGEMCAMKEVTLFSSDPKSTESANQLQQEIALLSHLRHPNIVQYFGSETVGDKLYIYMEYVSGGSIYKLLQEYGQLGELAIRTYTQQLLSGLAFLHGKNIVHRDIKGANILVDTNGRVKLADFGMVKHIKVQSCPLSFKGSPHWMAPEVIKNSNGCNLAVDIWSLGCTVLEMATTKPPWSQYGGAAAMFKIGNSKDLPAIADHLSDDGKDFVRLCLQRNPQLRPTAAQLLEHPFVKSTVLLERPFPSVEVDDILNEWSTLGAGLETNISSLDFKGPAVHSSRVSSTRPCSSEYHIPRNISCPVSPIGSPLLHPRSPQHLSGMMSPSPISSSCTTSGSSTPLMGGCGAIPIHHSHQSLFMPEGFGALPKSPNSVIPNVPCYHDPSPNKLRELHSGPHTLATLVSSESGTCKNQVERERPCQVGDPFKGRTVFGDRLTQELIWKLVQKNPSVEFSPRLILPNRTHDLYPPWETK